MISFDNLELSCILYISMFRVDKVAELRGEDF